MKKKCIFAIFLMTIFLFASGNIWAEDSPVAVWKTIDDDGKTAKSHVQIFEKDGAFHGKIVKLLKKPPDTLCDKCKGDKKDKPLLGMEIMWGLKKQKDGKTYGDGKIMDPDNGKTYTCKIWREGNELRVRGYIAFFYRTQTWQLVE